MGRCRSSPTPCDPTEVLEPRTSSLGSQQPPDIPGSGQRKQAAQPWGAWISTVSGAGGRLGPAGGAPDSSLDESAHHLSKPSADTTPFLITCPWSDKPSPSSPLSTLDICSLLCTCSCSGLPSLVWTNVQAPKGVCPARQPPEARLPQPLSAGYESAPFFLFYFLKYIYLFERQW